MTVGRWSLGALVVALGWTLLGASTSAHASDEPIPGLLGTVSEVTSTVASATSPTTEAVAAAPTAVVTAVTLTPAPRASALVSATGETTSSVAPVVQPVPAIVIESVTAFTPPVVGTLVTTIAGTPLFSAVTTPVVSLVNPLEGIPVVGPTVVTPILDLVDPTTSDLPTMCTSLLGGCVSVTDHELSIGGALQLQADSTVVAASTTAGTSWASPARLLATTANATPNQAAASASVRVSTPERPATPTAPSGQGVLVSTTSVNTTGGSAGANSATVPPGIFIHPVMADAPHGHGFPALFGPADDLSSSPD